MLALDELKAECLQRLGIGVFWNRRRKASQGRVERVMRSFVPQPDALDEDGNPMWGVDLNRLRQNDVPATLPIPPAATNHSSASHTPGSGIHSVQQPRQNEVEAAVTLEFLALGRDTKETHFSRAEIVRPAEERSSAGDSIGEAADSISADPPSPWGSATNCAPAGVNSPSSATPPTTCGCTD